MLTSLREAQRKSGDSLGDIVNLIEYLGVDEVLRILIDPDETGEPPSGFVRLMKSDLARFTIEQVLVDFAASCLLTKLQVETARARLALYSRSCGGADE
ncbi:hypothetical protein [Bradyrhizobium sp. BRP56]|uniref:hypothetical protein n=1 Tax=Bradyrhizobium sp. BRP56 TaxID=2793819 RepID=UPI001CD4B307|nr:hypothetical protein [Bradyrhizobium sp. BRP56]MCA1399097.1 hypothetical protein [Bradyrhizobium sp. BRP56]